MVTSADKPDPISLRRLRLPRLTLSRSVRFTNRFTEQVIELVPSPVQPFHGCRAAPYPVAPPARTPGGELMAYHHRTGTMALTLALALGVLATTAAQLPDKPSSPASASPCSEVCSGGGYFGNSNTTRPANCLPAIP